MKKFWKPLIIFVALSFMILVAEILVFETSCPGRGFFKESSDGRYLCGTTSNAEAEIGHFILSAMLLALLATFATHLLVRIIEGLSSKTK